MQEQIIKFEALKYATEKHDGQKRWNGDDYITHPIRVSQNKILQNDIEVTAALLHDVVEDTDTHISEINEKFGIVIASIVDILTHKKNEEYYEYILRCSKSSAAARIKVADLEDNLRDLKMGSMRDKYLFAKWYLLTQIEN